jgi:hypothetical protein
MPFSQEDEEVGNVLCNFVACTCAIGVCFWAICFGAGYMIFCTCCAAQKFWSNLSWPAYCIVQLVGGLSTTLIGLVMVFLARADQLDRFLPFFSVRFLPIPLAPYGWPTASVHNSARGKEKSNLFLPLLLSLFLPSLHAVFGVLCVFFAVVSVSRGRLAAVAGCTEGM